MSADTHRDVLVRFARGLADELRGLLGVLPLLRWPFWLAALVAAGATQLGWIAGAHGLAAQAAVVALLGLVGVFSGRVARGLRARRWVRFADGPEVAPYLPQLLIVLASPLYVVAMTLLFWRLDGALAGFPATDGLRGAATLALDNLLRTQVFFDVFEIAHLQWAPPASGFAARTVLLGTRILMDIAFVKLIVLLVRAAVHRARGLGRGDDMLFAVHRALAIEDAANVRFSCGAVARSLGEATDALVARQRAGGAGSDVAWRSLVAMRGYAAAHLERRLAAATGAERDALEALAGRLRAADDADAAVPPASHRRGWLLPVGWLLLAGLVVAPSLLPTPAALPLAAVAVALLGWLLIEGRGWLLRLESWGALDPFPPPRLPRRILAWALLIGPLLIAAAAQLVQTTSRVAPGIFSGQTTPASLLSSSVFVFENLLRTQLFLDALEVYQVHVVPLENTGWLGGLLTLTVRVLFDASVIAIALSLAAAWFNRLVRGFDVVTNAELGLRTEALEPSRHSPLWIGYLHDQIRTFLTDAMARHAGHRSLFVALAESGFGAEYAAAAPGQGGDDRAAADEASALAEALYQSSALEDARRAYERALALFDRLPDEAEVTRARAAASSGLGQVLFDLGRLADAQAAYEAARSALERQHAAGRPEAVADLGDARAGLGLIAWRQSKLTEARDQFEAAIALFEARIDADPTLRHNLATARSNLGNVLVEMARLEDAIDCYRRALPVLDALIEEGLQEARADRAAAHLCLGSALQRSGRLGESLSAFETATRFYEQQYREGRIERREDLARARHMTGELRREQGDLTGATADFEAARDAFAELVRGGRLDLVDDYAAALNSLGSAYDERGERNRAQTVFASATELFERLADADAATRAHLATARTSLGVSLWRQGRLDAAAAEHRAAIALLERAAAEVDVDPEDLAIARLGLAHVASSQGRQDEAVPLYRDVIATRERLVDGGRTELAPRLALARYSLSVALIDLGDLTPAIAEAEAAATAYVALIAAGQPELRKDLALARNNWGLALDEAGQPARAAEVQQQACDGFATLIAEGRSELRADLARSQSNLGRALLGTGRTDEAAAAYRQAETTYGALIDAGQEDLTVELARTRLGLGGLERGRGRLDEAARLLGASVESYRALVAGGREDLAGALATAELDLGATLQAAGRLEDASEHLERALAALRAEVETAGRVQRRRDLARAALCLSSARRAQRRTDEALALADEATAIHRALLAAGHAQHRIQLAGALAEAGRAQLDLGRPDDAAQALGEALAVVEAGAETLTDPDLRAAELRVALAPALLIGGRLAEAALQLEAAVEVFGRHVEAGRGELEVQLGLALGELGRTYHAAGRYENARAALARSIEVDRRQVAAGRADLGPTLAALQVLHGTALRELGRFDLALEQLQAGVTALETLVGEGRDELALDLANARAQLGGGLSIVGRADEAIALLEAGVATFEARVGEGVIALRPDLAAARARLGEACRVAGRLDDAERHGRAAVETLEGLVAEGKDEQRALLAGAWQLLAGIRSSAGRPAEAAQAYDAAADLHDALHAEGRDGADQEAALARAGQAHALAGIDPAAARASFDRAIPALETAYGRLDAFGRHLAAAWVGRARVAQATEPERAIADLRAALAVYRERAAAGDTSVRGDAVTVGGELGDVLAATGDAEAAEGALVAAITLDDPDDELDVPTASAVAGVANKLGILRYQRGDATGAAAAYWRAVELNRSLAQAEVPGAAPSLVTNHLNRVLARVAADPADAHGAAAEAVAEATALAADAQTHDAIRALLSHLEEAGLADAASRALAARLG